MWWLIVIVTLILSFFIGVILIVFDNAEQEQEDVGKRKEVTYSPNFITPGLTRGIYRRLFRPLANTPLVKIKSPMIDVKLPSKDIPKFFLYNPFILTPVQNQGICGSCWAFIVCEMLANRIAVKTSGIFRHNLSAQELIDCYIFTPPCMGANPEDVLVWLENTSKNIVDNIMNPYRQFNSLLVEDTACLAYEHGVSVLKNSIKSLVKFTVNDPEVIKSNVLNMKSELILNGPFFATIQVYSDFYDWDGQGVYTPSKNATKDGGHAILIVGYSEKGQDQTVNGLPYWWCKNTWGRNWAEKYPIPGYFRVMMGNNTLGIESRCVRASPKYKIPTDEYEKGLPQIKTNQKVVLSINDYMKYI